MRRKALHLCRDSDIWVKCTVKLKCTPKAVTNIQLSFSQNANTALPGPAKSKFYLSEYTFNYYPPFWTSGIMLS